MYIIIDESSARREPDSRSKRPSYKSEVDGSGDGWKSPEVETNVDCGHKK